MKTNPAANASGLCADGALCDVVDKARELFRRGGGRWAKNLAVHPDVGLAPDGVHIDAAEAWRRDPDFELVKLLGPSQLAQGIEQSRNLLDVATKCIPAAGLLNHAM